MNKFLTVVQFYSSVALVAVAFEVSNRIGKWVGPNVIIIQAVPDMGGRI